MSLLLGFVPFAVFALLDRTVGGVVAFLGAATIAAALLARDVFVSTKTIKLLDVGTVMLFGGLGLCKLATSVVWSTRDVRLLIDLGLLAIVVISLLVRRPFTLQYAREQTPPEVWTRPRFMQINYAITFVWALAFAAIVVSDLATSYANAPGVVGEIVSTAAIGGAIVYTRRASRPAG